VIEDGTRLKFIFAPLHTLTL